MVKVHIPGSLRPLTAGMESVEATGLSVGEVCDSLERMFPGIAERLCHGGELRRFFRIAVNDEMVAAKNWRRSVVRPGDTVRIVSAIAGG